MSKKFFEKSVLEKHIEAEGNAFAFRRGWLEFKLTSPSRRGWPDRFYVRRGVIILVEWKRPGEEPTVQQAKLHRELRDAGVKVYWMTSLEQAKEVFQ